MQYVGQRLDKLMHVDKELLLVGVQCTVSIPDALSPATDVVPIALSFYHEAPRTKFDVLLTLDGEQLAYSQFVAFYGQVGERHLVDVVHLALQNRYFPIRRLVTAVLEAIDQLS